MNAVKTEVCHFCATSRQAKILSSGNVQIIFFLNRFIYFKVWKLCHLAAIFATPLGSYSPHIGTTEKSLAKSELNISNQ